MSNNTAVSLAEQEEAEEDQCRCGHMQYDHGGRRCYMEGCGCMGFASMNLVVKSVADLNPSLRADAQKLLARIQVFQIALRDARTELEILLGVEIDPGDDLSGMTLQDLLGTGQGEKTFEFVSKTRSRLTGQAVAAPGRHQG
jgi:hypothetical protein